MTVREMLSNGSRMLKLAKIESSALEAGMLLCYVLKCDKVYIHTRTDEQVSPVDSQEYIKLIDKRAAGVPLQYLIGKQEFMSLDFQVKSGVLIPRHDTETLVEAVLDESKKTDLEKITILDIGTGSACIAISLAYYLKNSRVYAIDISEDALSIARANAIACGVKDKIIFLKSNIFGALDKDKKKYSKFFDIIVSNPPYISTEDINNLSVEVKDHEPLIALDGGADGLCFYRKIIQDSNIYLKPGGILAFEVGINQAEPVEKLMFKMFDNISIIKDLSGIKRVVLGYLKC